MARLVKSPLLNPPIVPLAKLINLLDCSNLFVNGP